MLNVCSLKMEKQIQVKSLFVFLVLIIILQTFASVESSHDKQQLYEELQKIPPLSVTAKKFMKYFLDRDPDKIGRSKRQIFLPLTQYDVTYVIDSSSSVSEYQFNKGKSALLMLLQRARRNTLYAAVTVSTRARLVFNFTDVFTAQNKLQEVRRTGGKTNTQEALQICYELYSNTSSGVRLASFKRILIMTDGQSNINRSLTIENAFRVKQLGVQIFVVAVGEYLDGLPELVAMASTTYAHMYRVSDLRGFAKLVKLIPPSDGSVTDLLNPGGGLGRDGPLPL